MKNKTAKQIVALYKAERVLLTLLYAAALALLIFIITKNVLLGIVGTVLLAISVRAAFDKLTEKNIDRVIYKELDPEKFAEILALGVLKKSSHHKLLLAMTSGDYDEVLALIEKNKAKSEINPMEKCNDLYREGYVCFERGDLEGLERAVRGFERLKAQNPKLSYAFSKFSVFEKFDAFLDEDYEYVVDVCDIDLSRLTEKEINHNLTRVNVSFYRAVSLYKMGRTEEAKRGFEDIIAFAPKMHKARLSREYLDLINK